MARSRSKAKSVAKPARRRSSRRAGAARAHEAALAAFAHDIRTALTGILALGELLASSTLGGAGRTRTHAAPCRGAPQRRRPQAGRDQTVVPSVRPGQRPDR